MLLTMHTYSTNFSISVFTNSNSRSNIDLTCETAHCMSEIDFTEQEVYTALINLNPTKGTGIDGIGPQVLKNCVQVPYISRFAM